MSAFYKAVLVRTLKGLIISGRAPNGADGGNADGGWEFFLTILGCHEPAWVGDGMCDDLTNTLECNYDGGDCCGTDIVTTECNICVCLDEGTNSTYCYFQLGYLFTNIHSKQ